MYLEISNIAAAIGKNPYENKELIYLQIWARENKEELLKFLIQNNLISVYEDKNKIIDDIVTNVYEEVLSKVDKNNFTTNDFSETKEKIVKECIKNEVDLDKEDISKIKGEIETRLIKDNGNIQEEQVIKKHKFESGNNKMWYYKIPPNVFGGRHDAIDNDIVIEIKSRISLKNVRKNEYDLYQLIGYLLAMNKKKGKIVQNYNKQIFDSDIENENEYGIIDLNEDKWMNYANFMIKELEIFFQKTENIIKEKNLDISNIKKYGKIAEIVDNNRLVNINNKYKNLCKLLNTK